MNLDEALQTFIAESRELLEEMESRVLKVLEDLTKIEMDLTRPPPPPLPPLPSRLFLFSFFSLSLS